MGVRFVHRRALAVICFSPTFEFCQRFVRYGVGGEEETGEGVAYQLHMYTIDMYH